MPQALNQQPLDIRQLMTYGTFKQHLKTCLLNAAYGYDKLTSHVLIDITFISVYKLYCYMYFVLNIVF